MAFRALDLQASKSVGSVPLLGDQYAQYSIASSLSQPRTGYSTRKFAKQPDRVKLGMVGRPKPVRALTESAELPLESVAPPFTLLEPLTGREVSLEDFEGALVKLANDYKEQGVQLVGISSNSPVVKPQDGPIKMAADAKEQGYPFPYLWDSEQDVAMSYQALCTPEFFLFDKELKLRYHGQFDDARPSNGQTVTGKDVRQAIDSVLNGQIPAAKSKPSIGCSIKWHPGKEPAYA